MRIGFDIGGVLSKYPEVFKPLVEVLTRSSTVEVFVITDMCDHPQSVNFVQENGYNISADHILNADYSGEGELCKAKLIKKYNIDLFIDDFPGYCNNTECVNLFVWPNPFRPYYSPDFKTDGTEGDFGRHCSSKNEDH